MYFDSTDISESNKASKVIPLQGSFVESLETGMDAKSFGFQLVCPSRSYVFSCDRKDDLDLWLANIAEEINVANSLIVAGVPLGENK